MFPKRPPTSKPQPILHHHRVRTLERIQPYLDYLPVARSLGDYGGGGGGGGGGAKSTCPATELHDKLQESTWISDHSVVRCAGCNIKFRLFWVGKHHCRVCGNIFCDKCTPPRTVGFAHSYHSSYANGKLLCTNLDRSNHSDTLHPYRICSPCNHKVRHLDRVYQFVRVFSIVLRVFPQSIFSDTQGENIFSTLDMFGRLNHMFQHVAQIMKRILVTSQYIYSNPWNTTEFIPHMMTFKQEIQRNMLCGLRGLSGFNRTDHYFYQMAFMYYGLSPTESQGPVQVLCRDTQTNANTMEMYITMLFHERVYELIPWTLEMAEALTPTLLIRGMADEYFFQVLVHFTKQITGYPPRLFMWIHSMDLRASFLVDLQSLFPPSVWAEYTNDWNFFDRLCDVARRSNGDLRDPKFQELATTARQTHPGIVGHPELRIVQLDVQTRAFRRAKSSSRPYIIPCRILNIQTNTYIQQTLLVKHDQSLAADGIVHLLIDFFRKGDERLITYPTIPIGATAGIILMVPDSTTIYAVGSSLKNKIQNHPLNNFKTRRELAASFAYSTAFFTMLTCFLGLRDRIDSNMMVQPSQSVMFHIDFEYVFDKQPRLKQTIRNVSSTLNTTFSGLSSFLQPSKPSSSSSSGRSGKSFRQILSRHSEDDGTVVITPLLPDPVIDMLGGYKSSVYTELFEPQCNAFFQLFWNNRHFVYYTTKFLIDVPSTTEASQMTKEYHDRFFRDFVHTVLDGSDTYSEQACKVFIDSTKAKSFPEQFLHGMNVFAQKRR